MQFRLRLVAALKKEFRRLTGSTEGVTSISTAKLGEEEGVTKAIAEGADEGGRAARKSEKVGRVLCHPPITLCIPLRAESTFTAEGQLETGCWLKTIGSWISNGLDHLCNWPFQTRMAWT